MNRIALQGNEKHSNALCRFYESVYRVERLYRNAMSSTEAHYAAQQGMAKKSTATRYADSMSRYIELKDSKALN